MTEVDFVRCTDPRCEYTGRRHCHPVGERRVFVLKRNLDWARQHSIRSSNAATLARMALEDAQQAYDDALAKAKSP